MRIISTATALLTGVALASMLPAAVMAQAPTASGAPEAPADPMGTIGEPIIVSAEHRQENIRDVPVSVAVIKPELLHDLQAGGADTLLSLAGRVPSLNVESSTGRIFPRFYIRGLGNIDFYLGASQPVSITSSTKASRVPEVGGGPSTSISLAGSDGFTSFQVL